MKIQTSIISLLICFTSVRIWAGSIDVHQKPFMQVGDKISYIIDSLGDYEVATVRKLYEKNQFKKSNSDLLNFAARDSVVWIAFSINSEITESVYFSFGDAFSVWTVDAYHIDSTNKSHHFLSVNHYNHLPKIGSLLPYESLASELLTSSNNEYYLFRLSAKVPRTYQFTLGDLHGTIEFLHLRELFSVAFIVLMVSMFFYNGFLLLSTRDIIYIPYLLYVLYIAYALPFHSGYILFHNPWLLENDIIWSCLGYWTATSFALLYLEMKTTASRFRWLIIILTAIVGLVYPLLLVVGFDSALLQSSLFVFSFLYNLTLLISGIYVWTQGFYNARFYVLGWTFVVLSMFIYIFWMSGLVVHPYSQFATIIGFSLEAILFALALGDRMNRLKKEKSKMQIENLNLTISQNKLLAKQSFMNSHLLRAPLSRIMGINNLLKQKAQSNEELKDLVDLMDESTQEMDGITRDISHLLEKDGYMDRYQSEFEEVKQDIHKRIQN